MVFFFYICKSTFIRSTPRYLKSICWLNATTSELCLLFTDLRALRTTREGWEAAFTPVGILGSGSGQEILAIALCPQINFLFTLCTGHISLFFTSRSFVSNLPPTPPPPPANHCTLWTKFASKMWLRNSLCMEGMSSNHVEAFFFLLFSVLFLFVCFYTRASKMPVVWRYQLS